MIFLPSGKNFKAQAVEVNRLCPPVPDIEPEHIRPGSDLRGQIIWRYYIVCFRVMLILFVGWGSNFSLITVFAGPEFFQPGPHLIFPGIVCRFIKTGA